MKTTKTFPLLALILLIASPAMAQEAVSTTTIVREGVGLGTVIAVVASWSRNESILWAILHGILSWIYVVYFALTR